jgi:hypothetical protein
MHPLAARSHRSPDVTIVTDVTSVWSKGPSFDRRRERPDLLDSPCTAPCVEEVTMRDHEGTELDEIDETPASTPDRLTRRQAAERLGFSISKIRTMEGNELHPIVENGVNYFAVAEVDALAQRTPAKPKSALPDGQLAARVFRLLDAGKNLREIVIELEEEPDRIRALYREWSVPDFAEGERQRLRRERQEEQRRESEAWERSAERSAREWEKQMAAAVASAFDKK